MLRIGKIALVWMAVVLLAVDPVAACRFRHARRCCPPRYYYRCYRPCLPVTCAPAPSCCATTTVPSAPADDAPAPPAPNTYAPTPAPSQLNKPEVESLPAPRAPATLEPSTPVPPAPEPPTPSLDADVPAPEPAPTFDDPAPAPAPAEDMPEEPARPAKPDAEVEDLFKETEPAAPAAADEPAAPGEKKKDEVDDLFKETRLPATTAPVANQAELDELFAEPTRATEQTAEVAQPSPAESTNALRTWTDSTGKYEVKARLVMVSQTHVRLLKETGKYTTVSLDRLSHADLAFVRQHSNSVIASN